MKNITPKKFHFTETELRHLSRAWIALSFAFAVLMNGFSLNMKFIISMIIASITVGLGFLLHEIAHKYLANKYRCNAEFRANDTMLLVMVFMSFLGFILAAPGGVIIKGHLSRKQHGKIAMAGPLTNLVLGGLFLLLFLATPLPLIKMISNYGMFINSWLAVFNMIPFSMFDGSKILAWNKSIYYALAAGTVFLLILIQII